MFVRRENKLVTETTSKCTQVMDGREKVADSQPEVPTEPALQILPDEVFLDSFIDNDGQRIGSCMLEPCPAKSKGTEQTQKEMVILPIPEITEPITNVDSHLHLDQLRRAFQCYHLDSIQKPKAFCVH